MSVVLIIIYYLIDRLNMYVIIIASEHSDIWRDAQIVEMSDYQSELSVSEFGVSQGSILGPLLFLGVH